MSFFFNFSRVTLLIPTDYISTHVSIGPCMSDSDCSSDHTCDTSGGFCKCGSVVACHGLSDTCTSGVCKCGTGNACDAQFADSCISGSCKCGTSSQCTGQFWCQSNTCSGNDIPFYRHLEKVINIKFNLIRCI